MKSFFKKSIVTLVLALAVIGMFSHPADASAATKKVGFEKTEYELYKGEVLSLKLKNVRGNITWGSTSPKVAKVDDNGTVTALKSGTAIIVATKGNTSYACTINVNYSATFTYKGHFYRAIDYGMTWEDAKAYCEGLGGHLVTITSKGEQNAFVKFLKHHPKISKNNYWMGGYLDKSFQLHWITDETVDYTAWAAGQPDFYTEPCIMIYRYDNPKIPGTSAYLWNNLVNEGIFNDEEWFGLENFGFVCEWDSIPTEE